jgi:purine-nucleoside phosphorylase
MSVHISAKQGEIASVVLMPGDPLRAKYIAEKWLVEPKLVSTTRNVFFYTGKYKDVNITIGASGMGCPSIGIYSYELFKEYGLLVLQPDHVALKAKIKAVFKGDDKGVY